jgi:hypothetical protein
MSSKKELSATGKLELGSVLNDLHHLRKSAMRPVTRGASLVELFVEEVRSMRSEGTAKPSSVMPFFMQKLGLPADGPIARAGLQTSLKAEELQKELNYHNEIHVVEVILASYVLGKRERLPIYRIAELLIAAAAHDLGHTGQNNKFNYELEINAFEMAKPILEQAGLPAENIERIRYMILATDYKVGAPAARKAYLDTRNLAPLDDQRLMASQAVLLTEADVLFSCFNMSYNELLSKLLSEEWKRPDSNLSLKERMGFLSSVQFVSDASRQLGLEERRQSLISEIARTLHENGQNPETPKS